MKTLIRSARPSILTLLILTGFSGFALAQEVSIPDPGLNAAIRANLQIPTGPLTEPDLLNLTNLTARGQEVKSLAGLETARNLTSLDLQSNQLANVTFPDTLGKLTVLNLSFNSLTNLTLPYGLTNLTNLLLSGNQLNALTLPPDLTELTAMVLDGNPLTALILSEPLAAANLTTTVTSLQDQGIPVYTYPLIVQLVRPRTLEGAFQFGIIGPPGFYTVLGSTNLADWGGLRTISNGLGSINFLDSPLNGAARKFYRAQRQVPPPNMIFIPTNTFTMGSPAGEQDRNSNEGPQTIVTLTRGFWISKYEVTQGEFLAVMNSNPSVFPGDLNRAVSSVSWPDATNYCWLLTQRELAAGRITQGSRYRLPTEAEWECAARAGTTTRFSYGDDPGYTSVTDHGWTSSNSGITVHAVGRKLPNPWGLYDMEGNVWEWCQDWLGPLPGGIQTDPIGPDSNPIGWKVMRGGAYDYSEPDCRSARRLFFPSHPALSDSDLGFRVVLVSEPQ